MNSIDQRIVEMQFDNAQFEKGVSTSLKSLDNLKKKLNLDREAKSLSGLEKAGKNFSLSGMASNIETVASKFSAMGILGVTAMHRISNAAITTGKNLVSALTVDPVKSGLSEYETQINAIQTILSNTRAKGTTIDDVNEALDLLNTYADKTIYNFTEMTRNIGTFTAAGVDLNTSTAAIKGIANLAAVSGSNSQQASTAMYQLSQALAAGTIRLMDWNSLVNAGMGGEVLQDALKETARVHGIAIDNIIKKEGSFRESLQNGWLSSEIMLETLNKFTGDLTKEEIRALGYTEAQAEEIIKLGKDANDAATKVKTFTQLIDTLKEALQSGWTQSWEYVIGNFEEAREFWTSVSDAIGMVIGQSAEARNELLKGWYEAGGRNDLIAGIKDTFSALYGIVVAVKDAMREVFPETTVDDLLNISTKVKDFGKQLKTVLKYYKELDHIKLEWTTEKSPIEKFSADLERGMRGEEVKKLQKKLKDLGYDLGAPGVDGIFGPITEAALKKYQKDMGLAVDGVFKTVDNESLFGTKETTKFNEVREYVYKFSEALEKVKHIAKGAFSALSVGVRILGFLGQAALVVLDIFKPIGSAIVSVAMALSDCFINLDESMKTSTKFSEWLAQLKTYLAPLSVDLESVKQSILDFFGIGDAMDDTPEKVDTFIELWTKFKAVAAENLPKIRSKIGKFFSDVYKRVRSFVIAVPGFVSTISGFFVGLYNQVKNSEKFQTRYKKVTDFLTNIKNSLSEFFTVVQNSIKEFFSKDTTDTKSIGDQFKERLAVFESVGEWLSNTWGKISGFIKGVWNSISAIAGTIGTGGLLAIIGAIIFGVKAGKTISNIAKFADNVSAAFNSIAKSLKISKKTDKLKEVRNLILAIALAVGTLVAAIYIIGNMDHDKMKQGAIVVGSVVGGLILLATAATVIGDKSRYFKSAKNIGKAIFQFAAAIGILAASVIILGLIDWGKFLDGAGKMAGIMFILGTFVVLVNKLGGSGLKMTGLLSVAGAIGILGLIARLIGGMDQSKFWKGVAGITGIALILGVFAVAVNKLGGSGINTWGLIGVTLAIGLLGVIATMLAVLPTETLLKGIGAISGIALALAGAALALSAVSKNLKIGPALVAIGGFALIIVAFGYVLEKIRDIDPSVMISFVVSLAATLAAVMAALWVAGTFAGAIGTGALVIGVIAGVAGIIIGILGAIDEHCGGAIVSAMKAGGEVMQAFGEAVGKFIGGIGGGILEAFSESAGGALTTFGESITTFSDKISGISASESLSSDIDTVIGIATAMAAFFDGLGGITLNLTALPIFNSGTETLATDMETFGTAISGFETAVSGMSEGTFVDDATAALSAATSIRDFLDGISKLDIEKNKSAIMKWITGDTVTGSLFSQMATLGESIASLNTNFGGLSQNGFAENVKIVQSSMESLTGLLTSLSSEENQVEVSGLFKTSNFAKIVEQLGTLSTTVTTFNTNTKAVDETRFQTIVDSISTAISSLITISTTDLPKSLPDLNPLFGQLSGYAESINSTGAELGNALTSGIASGGADISAVTGICTECISAVRGYRSSFESAGAYLSVGLSVGLKRSRSIVTAAAKSVMQSAIAAAKSAAQIRSPSRVGIEIGKFFDLGIAGGIMKHSTDVDRSSESMASSMISAAKTILSNLSSVLASDIDSDPVIRPVVDMSNVTSSAQMINGLMSGSAGTISFGASTSAKIASAINTEASRKNQNGSSGSGTSINQNSNSAVNLTGNNFYVRDEQDIHSLASEIATLTHQQQRALGST